ncbi:MAG: hydantoinase B/oxoprolinase family protein [Betaproteobacteria bacterium]|nr:hydantoinase B/oxoprolinase family protein [Betaproteobacteria bacterium]
MIVRYEFDAGTLEIMWSRLTSIADEAATTLVRTSFSTVVRESKDLSCALFDTLGCSLSQAAMSMPAFTGTMPLTMKHFLKRHPVEKWLPGDVVITNDPWLGSGHLPDISMALPIFRGENLVGFTFLVAHAPDIGGRTLSATCKEIFEEGLRIPICHLYRAGEACEQVIDFIRNNVRVPDEVLGDLHAMVAAGEVARRRLLEFMVEFKLSDLSALANEIQFRAERAMREQIRALPDGAYRYTLTTDGMDEELTIALTLRVMGDRLELDYSGTSPQQPSGINAPLCYTHSFSVYAVKSVLTPAVPNNEGTFRPILVTAPAGCILNPRFPAATGARSTTGHFVVPAVYGAMAQLVPERVLAECGAPRPIVVLRGSRDDGHPFSQTIFCMGSMGARPTQDGISCIAFPTNCWGTPVEVLESSTTAIRVGRKELIPESGGAGRFRGGYGQRYEIESTSDYPLTISVRADRTRNPAKGLAGGLAGACTHIRMNGKDANPKGITMAKKGDILQVDTPGSGGHGDPLEREPERVCTEVRYGLVTVAGARSLYGVVVDSKAGGVDLEATTRLRSELRKKRTKEQARTA